MAKMPVEGKPITGSQQEPDKALHSILGCGPVKNSSFFSLNPLIV